ncbi:MAG: hypothetical protein K2X11_20980 [Acetobacteraceae bacterium]|nr:hypothetical protein [Acetobacteraceae bacterium]
MTTAGPPPALMAALAQLLRPLLRVLIHFGVTFPAFAALLKRLYVAEAMRGFTLPGRPLSDSRITLLTGVHRKDVSALRDAPPDKVPKPRSVTLAAQVLSRWAGHGAWQAADGTPRPLPRGGGEVPGFDDLVASVSRDIRPRALLDELLRSGLVRARPDGLLEMLSAADVPRATPDRLAYYFGRNLADHIAASGHNLVGGQPPHPERALAFDGLSADAVDALRRQAEHLAMDMLLRLNAEAQRLAEEDPPAPGEARRFTTGIYIYSAPDDAGEEA